MYLLPGMKIENTVFLSLASTMLIVALQALIVGIPMFILSNTSNPKNDFGHSKKSAYENCCANR